jgi:hypothetical protein
MVPSRPAVSIHTTASVGAGFSSLPSRVTPAAHIRARPASSGYGTPSHGLLCKPLLRPPSFPSRLRPERSASGSGVFFPRRESGRYGTMRAPRPHRASHSRTSSRPPSEVTREPWKSPSASRCKRAEKADSVAHPGGLILRNLFIAFDPTCIKTSEDSTRFSFSSRRNIVKHDTGAKTCLKKWWDTVGERIIQAPGPQNGRSGFWPAGAHQARL